MSNSFMGMTVTIRRILIGSYCATAVIAPTHAADTLPVPCATGACGISGPSTWVTEGAATAVYQNNSLTINQTSQNAEFNWRSFNIAPDGSVEFKQPDATSVALNRIFQADPSRIFGGLKANGRIYLVNQNGIIFGEGARVNVGSLVASTLNMRPEALESGLTGGGTTPIVSRFTDPDTGELLQSAALQVQEGALLQSDGGQIFLFAPVVENKGRIETPDGQTILAAGQSVYLSATSDSNLRGLLVAVDLEGTVENGDASNASVTDPAKLVGQIIAERGNLTLAGLTVNQRGRVSATTSVRANGSVRLVAAIGSGGGNLTLGEGSRTEVLLDNDAESKTVDVNEQPRSNILLAANRVALERNSSVVATSGNIRIKASNEGSGSADNPPLDFGNSDSRIFIDKDAVLDVSGTHVTRTMESNLLTIELRGSQLADSPDQRNGALRGQRVQVDIRRTGTREDGSTWVGSPLADLNGDVSTIARTIAERSLAGGTVALESQGDVIVAEGAKVNVSGGSVRYEDGYITPSALLGADGRIYDIGDADPYRDYVSVMSGGSSYLRHHPRWGITEQFQGSFAGGRGRFEQGYIEGKDAGSLSLVAPNVIFDGRLQADRVIGPNQRRPSANFSNTLYRPFDQIPVGGELLLGPATGPAALFVLGDVELNSGLVLPGLLNADGSAFNPSVDPLPDSLTATRVRPELLGEGAATRVAIRSDGSVLVPEQTQLTLPALSSVSITGRDVDFGGSISSAGGTVSLRAARTTTQQEFGQGELRFRDSARLNLAGAWVNESVQVNPGRATEPLAIAGGSATLQGVDSNVVLEPGSVIDVSGGARMTRNTAVTGGRGGSITIGASTSAGFVEDSATLELNGELRGYALGSGGNLTLSAGEVCIASHSTQCGDSVAEDAFLLTPERLRAGGFSSYSVSSNRRGLAVGESTEVILKAENLVLSEGAAAAASASSLSGLAFVAALDDARRNAVDLTLESAYLQDAGQLATAAEFADLPYLSILRDANIQADPGARISLESNTSIRVDGRIQASAGQISLLLNDEMRVAEYLPGQSIWLGDHARLSAAGTTRYTPNEQGLLIGEVLAGGSISMNAARGYVAANPFSQLDVSGAAGLVDVRSVRRGGLENYERQTIVSRAGDMSFTAAEGIFLGGDLRARSGDPANLLGGSLSVTLEASKRYGLFDVLPPLFAETARSIELASTAPVITFGAGAVLGSETAGHSVLSAESIEAAGFDHLQLEARTRSPIGNLSALSGEVMLRDGLDLNLRGSLSIDSASVLSDGGRARISAPVVTLGQRSTTLQGVPDELNRGNGALEVDAQLIDIVGHSVLSGFADVALRSSRDIRARGVQLSSARSLNGSLRTTGTLALDAQQIYPTTLSQFAFVAGESITVKAPDNATASPVYSAGGSLSLRAPTITQGGVLRAPFGTISLEADDLRLLAGSTTATSAAGLSIPFGQTQGGFDWVYQLGNQTLVYNGEDAILPGQSVKLDGAAVDIQSGATVDVRGGGDLVAHEFVPGVGGTRDVLSATVRDDAFVIVPASGMPFAPYDVSLYEGSSIKAGDSIYLEGVPGVPAGNYAILPARYAHLPGAYYVRPVSGYQDIGPNEANVRLDGSTLVSGYRTFAGTGLRVDGRSSGFAIRPGADVMREAQYNLSGANDFFAARAADAEVALTRLPRDAGTLSITAGEALQLNGNLLGAAAKDGRGTSLDISSDSLRVVNGTGAAPLDGVVDIDAAALTQFGAESILLGGSRLQTEEGLSIATQARRVEIADGAVLSAPELLLVGTEQVTVRDGAQLLGDGTLAGTSASDLFLQGDGALLRVTSGQDVSVQRTNASGGIASLQVEQGALLSARGGAVAAESAGTAQFAATLDVAGGVLSLTGDRISLGETDDLASGLILSNAQLAGLTLDALVLSSRSSIDFYGPLTLSAGELSLRSGALRGFGGETARVSATGTLTLEGAVGPDSEAAGTGAASLLLEAGNIVLAEGTSQITGFDSVAMSATDAIEVQGAGSLGIVADVSLSAARLTAASGATRDFDVQGAFVYAGVTAANAAAVEEPALGARLAINADSILFDGRVDLQSGVLSMFATAGNVVLSDSADLRLNGVVTTFDSVPVGSRGGWLTLESGSGNVSVSEGASINVASASNAVSDRGSMTVRAAQGSADIRGSLNGGGADFVSDANQFVDFMALNRRLTAGSFSGDRAIRQRGVGDLVVGMGVADAITAHSVNLIADQGRVVVDGSVRSHNAGGGSITLSGREGIVINGTLDASAADSSERNGSIELGTSQGPIQVASAARIIGIGSSGKDKSSADGTLHIRAPRSLLATLTDADATNNGLILAGDMTRLNAVTIEGYASYADVDGAITADEIAAVPGTLMYDDAVNFAAQSAQIIDGLGTIRGPSPQVLAGIEITSEGNLELQSDWSLNEWRFNGLPGYLTIRSAGDLTFNASLSDGFTADNPYLLTETGPSWSYRLSAGADLTSADPLAVRAASSLTPGMGGTLRVAEGSLPTRPTATPGFRMIRTGTGSIDIAAARNVELGNQASVIYTAGISTDGIAFSGRVGELGGRMYPDRGGDIRIVAGEDVLGAGTNQLVTDWLWRVGREDDNPNNAIAPAWTVNFGRFMQNIGALGGGNVSVNAGRDIRELSAVAPSIGRQVGGRMLSESRLEIVGGGNVDLRAQGSVLGGSVYSGLGDVSISAGDAIGRGPDSQLAPIVALGDARAYLSSRTDLSLATVVNPTLLRQGTSQTSTAQSYFSTYTDNAGISLASTSGDVTLLNSEYEVLAPVLSSMGVFADADRYSLGLFPADVSVTALRGDVRAEDSFALFPGAEGGLDLLAYNNVLLVSPAGSEVIVSDADVNYLPSLSSPQRTADRLKNVFGSTYRASPTGDSKRFFYGPIPQRLKDGRLDTSPSRVVAKNEDIRLGADNFGFYFAEPARVVAGRDIVGLSMTVQNLEDRDVSSVIAGRDIIYPLTRIDRGEIKVDLSSIGVDGLGTLELRAGRNVDLQTSGGVSSWGNLNNSALPGSGADISVQVGTASRPPDYAGFMDRYLASEEFADAYAFASSQYREDVIAYMHDHGLNSSSFEEAFAAFQQLPDSEQAPVLERILFSELRSSGRAAAQPGETNNDFTRGFDALTTFFPGANPDLDQGEVNPYSGDMRLYFSRIYTLSDGDIRLLTPGGEINAGLASPPSAFKLGKGAADLGIVAQRSGSINAVSFYDFLVNESRVFAADGGDILVWATQGDIDAGRGAKTAISAPPPQISFDPTTGAPIIIFPPALAGSGIQTLASTEGRKPGNVDLFAPRGVVNAGDAGIVAGNLTIAATAVLGADNIQVSGVAVGVPVDTGGLGASLASVSSVGSSASSAATTAVEGARDQEEQSASLADTALSWLEVFVVGLGEENCKQDDVECLKRQTTN